MVLNKETDAQEIYALAEELGLLETIRFFVASRAPRVPCDCGILHTPTLSAKSATHDTFYRIYEDGALLEPMDEFWGNSSSIPAPSIASVLLSTLRRRPATLVVVHPG